MDQPIDLVIEQLCLDIKRALLRAHNSRITHTMHDLPTNQIDRRIRILKAMLVAATKEA